MLVITSTLYLTFILVLMVRGFSSSKREVNKYRTPSGVSVIIPFRDESHNLEKLLDTLSTQELNIPFEIILVNDRSTDAYRSAIDSFIQSQPIFLLQVVDNHFDSSVQLTSKQQAIETGVSISKFDMLVFTDADMTFTSNWLSSLVAHFDTKISPFVFGRTSILKSSGLFNLIQRVQLDFLFATAHLLALAKIDSSCMGNNIGISRNLYNVIGGQNGLGYTIVEDKKLLTAAKKLGIHPVPVNPFTSLAFTYSVDSPTVFLHQMVRWLRGGASESIQILFIIILLGFELISISSIFFGGGYPLLTFVSLSGVIATWALYIREFRLISPTIYGFLLPFILLLLFIESLILIPAILFIVPQWKGSTLKKKRDHSC